MKVEKGSFVLVNYTAWVLDGEEKVIDTTYEEVARENNIYKENVVYEPELVIVGEGFILKPVEEALIGLEENSEKEIILEPEQAFGIRDPKNIRIFSARELTRRGIVPRVNEEVEINGRRGRIIRVGGGRVTIDFNHPYAGRRVKFLVKIEKILVKDEDKLLELFHRWFRGMSKEDVKVEITNEKQLNIEVPPTILQYEGAYILANGFTRDVEKYFEKIENVSIIEKFTIERKIEEKKEVEEERPKEPAETEEKTAPIAPGEEGQESQPQQQ